MPPVFWVGGTATKVRVTTRGRFVPVTSDRAMDAARNDLHEWDPGEAGAREDVERALAALCRRFHLPTPPPLGEADLLAPMTLDEFWDICQALSGAYGRADAVEAAWVLTAQAPCQTDDFERHLRSCLSALAPDALNFDDVSRSRGGPVDGTTLLRACSAVLSGRDTWQAAVNVPATLVDVPITPGAAALLRVANMAGQIRDLRIANTLLPAELLSDNVSINHVELLQLRHNSGALKLSPYADDNMIIRRMDGSEVSRDGWMTKLPGPELR